MDMNTGYILVKGNAILLEIKELREYAKKHNLLDDQTWIDFEDELNRLSVADPQD